jgi:D-glycero-D-manno-heptose 1,7-bisphosphate phosphatase
MPRLTDIGLWAERFGSKSFEGRPALFLDRDGVIIEDVHFIRRAEDVRMIEGVAGAINAANARHVAVVVITNQSGIARGHYGWEEFEAVEAEIGRRLRSAGAEIDLVLACGYHLEGTGPFAADHAWRKPQAGMLVEAAEQLGINLAGSFIVGDRLTDLAAGRAAGLRRGALVRTGYGAKETEAHADDLAKWRSEGFAVEVHDTAATAIRDWLAPG